METLNIIQCPHCKALMEPWDYIETGDMEGDFRMNCEECGKKFSVNFSTDIRFKTDS
jgi:DNA-directed RNA polymerase subunit M/transcription elongation factor TFIIS